MKKILITTPAQWAAWSEQWNRLAQHNPMISHDWLAAWWQTFGAGHQLHILAIEHEGRLLACLPTYLHSTKLGAELRWLGSGKVSSDYLSVLMAQHETDLALHPMESLWEMLQDSLSQGVISGWRGIRLEGMSQADPQIDTLHHRFGMRSDPLGNTWRIHLPETWQGFIDRVKKSHCYRKVKKVNQNIAAGKLTVRFLDTAEDADFGLETLIALHQLRRHDLGESGCFDDARFVQFLTEATHSMLNRGVARFLVCQASDQPIGIQLQLLGNDTVFVYQCGMDPRALKLEPGHALVAIAVRTAIEQGYQNFDFLRGDEVYKAFWSAEPIPLVRVCGSVDSWKSRSLASLEKRVQWLKMLGRGDAREISTHQ